MASGSVDPFLICPARQSWQLRQPPTDPQTAARLASELGLSPTMATILAGRGFSDAVTAEEFLQPGLEQLHSPFLFEAMEAAVERILSALQRGERIAVHGDYDVDGITGTVLLVTVLGHLGADVEFILPHRIDDGYGLNPSGIDKAHAAGARLLIAVDCGVTALAAAERATELGIDLIIADHHVPLTELPEAVAIINPRITGCGYPEGDLAAVGLAFKLARGVLQRHSGHASGISMLKLVALGTVADLVPLTGENRAMTWHGLRGLSQATNPGLRALLKVAGLEGCRVDAGDVAFRIGPRINAAGRLGHPNDAAELFLTRDPARATKLANRLQRLNSERQQVEKHVTREALEMPVGENDPIVVAAGEGWHRGVVGIVAARLVEQWGRPALAISIEGGRAYGSARSVTGFSIVGALDGVAELLDRHGGHPQAAGFELEASRIGELREALLATNSHVDIAALRPALLCDIDVDPEQITPALALELERLAPFGVGNPRPRLLCRDLHPLGEPQLLKEAHMKLRLRGGDGEVEALAWRRGALVEELVGMKRLDLVAKLKPRRWGGRLIAQLEIDDLAAWSRSDPSAAH